MLETAEEKKERLAQIARENGAKSRGPVTEEGKARSKMNRLKHGLYAAERVLLEDESEEEYEACRQALYEQLDPQSPAEERLVELIASTMWRMDRIPGLEADLFRRSESLQEALASPCMNALIRHSAALDRAVDRAMRRLKELQRLRSGTRSHTPVSDTLRARSAASGWWSQRSEDAQSDGTNPAPAPTPTPWSSPSATNKTNGTNPEPGLLRLARGEVEMTERTQLDAPNHLSRKQRRALAKTKRR